MKLTQKTFDKFLENQGKFAEALNHRMSSVESSVLKIKVDLKWIKILGYYMAGLITTIAVKFIVF